MLHVPPTNYLLLAAKQELCQKAYLLPINIKDFSGERKKKKKRSGEWASRQKNERNETEREDDENEAPAGFPGFCPRD